MSKDKIITGIFKGAKGGVKATDELIQTLEKELAKPDTNVTSMAKRQATKEDVEKARAFEGNVSEEIDVADTPLPEVKLDFPTRKATVEDIAAARAKELDRAERSKALDEIDKKITAARERNIKNVFEEILDNPNLTLEQAQKRRIKAFEELDKLLDDDLKHAKTDSELFSLIDNYAKNTGGEIPPDTLVKIRDKMSDEGINEVNRQFGLKDPLNPDAYKVSRIDDFTEKRALDKFHKTLGEEVKQRAEDMKVDIKSFIDDGTLDGLEIGNKILTHSGKKRGLPPAKITGYYIHKGKPFARYTRDDGSEGSLNVEMLAGKFDVLGKDLEVVKATNRWESGDLPRNEEEWQEYTAWKESRVTKLPTDKPVGEEGYESFGPVLDEKGNLSPIDLGDIRDKKALAAQLKRMKEYAEESKAMDKFFEENVPPEFRDQPMSLKLKKEIDAMNKADIIPEVKMNNKQAKDAVRQALRDNHPVVKDLSPSADIDTDLALAVKLGKMTPKEAAAEWIKRQAIK